MDQTPTTEPRLKAIETRQDKLEAEIIDHIEQQTHQMVTSFEAVNTRFDTVESRLDTLEKEVTAIQDTLKDHREIALSHGQLLRDQNAKLDQIIQLLQQKPGE